MFLLISLSATHPPLTALPPPPALHARAHDQHHHRAHTATLARVHTTNTFTTHTLPHTHAHAHTFMDFGTVNARNWHEEARWRLCVCAFVRLCVCVCACVWPPRGSARLARTSPDVLVLCGARLWMLAADAPRAQQHSAGDWAAWSAPVGAPRPRHTQHDFIARAGRRSSCCRGKPPRCVPPRHTHTHTHTHLHARIRIAIPIVACQPNYCLSFATSLCTECADLGLMTTALQCCMLGAHMRGMHVYCLCRCCQSLHLLEERTGQAAVKRYVRARHL